MFPGKQMICAIPVICVLCGCRNDMHDQPRYEPLQESRFFADGRSARPYVAGTVARGRLNDDAILNTGKQPAAKPVNGVLSSQFVDALPMPLTRALLERGRQRYDIYCSPCHGLTGEGNGMIVQRGFMRPPAYTSERVRSQPVGHYFDVITNGFGAMHSYASRVAVPDRWAIAAYIRVLQVSRSATISDVPADRRAALQEAAQ